MNTSDHRNAILYLWLTCITVILLPFLDASAQEPVSKADKAEPPVISTKGNPKKSGNQKKTTTEKEKPSTASGSSAKGKVIDRKLPGRGKGFGSAARRNGASGREWPTGMWPETEWNGKGRAGSDGSKSTSSHLLFLAGNFESDPIEEGFVFVNGTFLPGPYIFRSKGQQTFVNDILIADRRIQFPERFNDDDGGNRRRRSFVSRMTLAEFLSSRFEESTHAVVAFDGQSPEILPHGPSVNDLVCALVFEEDRTTLIPQIVSNLEPSSDQARWETWITSYQPSRQFLVKGQPLANRINESLAEDVARHTAIKRLDQLSYPLTIIGMVMSVFAIGHLMSNPPNGGRHGNEIENSPEVMQLVTRSLGLVIAFSLLDLVWTLLASQAGSMRELNPVAGRLIHDPKVLIVFKVSLTALAAGLMFKLRHYRRVQLASWWACLILTLLTVRWLTFNSMLA